MPTFMLVFADSGRTFEPADLSTAEDLANRAAVAVENCRLYHEARTARTAAEEANRAKKQANHEGTGLGLAISRELATAMGGRLVATSSAEGATFTLSVPISAAT